MLDKKGHQGRPTFQMAQKYLKYFRLKGKKLNNANEARIALMEGRPCLCRFYLDEKGWHNFEEFYKKNPTTKLTKKIMEETHQCIIKDKPGGHAAVFISIEKDCLKFLNSSGEKFGDKGYFRIKDENLLDHLEFMDIYWDELDLTKEEIEKYNNNYLSFINQVSKYLSQPNIDIKKELEKEVVCPECKNNLL